jgi:hypothetical protein
MAKTKQTEKFVVMQVSKGAHRQLKEYCAQNGMKLQYMVSFIIKQFLKSS